MSFVISMTFRADSNSLPSKLAKFSGIGLINTLLHTSIVVSLIELLHAHTVAANAAAFIVANVFSYWANRRWNFKAAGSIQQYGRFLIVSLVGLGLTILVSSLAAWAGWHYLLGLGLLFIALPALTFALHYQWTFRP